MSCSLKSAIDKETYEEYLDGKRRYFTVNGMEIDSTAQEKNTVDFLKNKYRNHEDYPVSTELVKSYVELYNMETGVIFSPDPLIVSATKYVGCIAYIEDDVVFMSYVVCLREFAHAEDKKNYVKDSFKPQGLWSYKDCRAEPLETSYYESRIAIKNLQTQNSLLSRRIETISRNSRLEIENHELRNRKSINKCFIKLYKCINKIDAHIKTSEERDADNILHHELMITKCISLCTACVIVFMLYIV
jgi:hypothetical protein